MLGVGGGGRGGGWGGGRGGVHGRVSVAYLLRGTLHREPTRGRFSGVEWRVCRVQK